MKRTLLDRLLFLLAFAALCSTMIHAHARGDELNLFEPPPVSQSVSAEIPLFELAPPCRPGLDLFGPLAAAEPPTIENPKSKIQNPPPPDLRPVVVVWSPTWCHVCREMERRVKLGDERVRVRWIKGDEAAFAKEVRDFANSPHPPGGKYAGQPRGWPVLQFQPADQPQTWLFTGHARTLDDLHRLTRCRRADPIPESTFAQSLQANSEP